MPIIRNTNDSPLEQQRAGREIGQLRNGTTRPNPNGGKPIPVSLETIRFTTNHEPAAEALGARYGVTPKRITLNNGQKTIEVLTNARSIEAVIPPGEAAISQWRELWGPGYRLLKCDAETEKLSGEPCKCPFDPAERKALAALGQACSDKTRVNVILPDIPGLGVWKISTGSYFAGLELGMTVEFLADLTAKGMPLPVVVGIDPRSKVQAPKGPNGKPQTTKFSVWTVDPVNTASEIAVMASNGYGMLDAISPASSVAIDSGETKALGTAPALHPQPDEELASPGQKAAIKARQALLSPASKVAFDRWVQNEKQAGGIHSWAHLRASEVEKLMIKLDIIDPDNAPPEWDDDEPVDAEIVDAEIDGSTV